MDPLYPPDARKIRYQGTELVDVTVLADGSVRVNRVLRSLDGGFPNLCRSEVAQGNWPVGIYPTPDDCPSTLGFDDAVTNAIRQWRFSPPLKDGVPTPVELIVEMDFTLQK